MKNLPVYEPRQSIASSRKHSTLCSLSGETAIFPVHISLVNKHSRSPYPTEITVDLFTFADILQNFLDKLPREQNDTDKILALAKRALKESDTKLSEKLITLARLHANNPWQSSAAHKAIENWPNQGSLLQRILASDIDYITRNRQNESIQEYATKHRLSEQLDIIEKHNQENLKGSPSKSCNFSVKTLKPHTWPVIGKSFLDPRIQIVKWELDIKAVQRRITLLQKQNIGTPERGNPTNRQNYQQPTIGKLGVFEPARSSGSTDQNWDEKKEADNRPAFR